MVGPILTFDKSFLQSLSADEVNELGHIFRISVTPVLLAEIRADLAHPRPKPGKISEEIVIALARKMVTTPGTIHAHWRMLALWELSPMSETLRMDGTVIVDPTAPNVITTSDGGGVIYDSRQDREMWGAWAAGNFSETDRYLAAKWRNESAKINIGEISESWMTFCAEYLPGVKTVADVIAGIDHLMSVPQEQEKLLKKVYHFVQAPEAARRLSMALSWADLLPRIKPWAPFCVSVTRLYMVFYCCTALKFITQRPTNALDLQYLFYAPFSMVFVSRDKLQRDLWPATTTQASFVWGDELKADLKRYACARKKTMVAREASEAPDYDTDRFKPTNSIIARLLTKHLSRSKGGVSSGGPTGDIENLPKVVKRNLHEARGLIDKFDMARGGPPKFYS